MGNQLSQVFPPAPSFTESSIPSLAGKVYIVTGASAGVGRELSRLLYSLNATVYLAARNSSKAQDAISWIQQSHPQSQGTLHFLKLDLNDLEGIKPSVEEFLAKEKRLDVLWNNAGVMIPPQGSLTKQGYDMQLGTNCVAPFLFTKLLTPILLQTAKTSPEGTVRVVWVSSSAAHLGSPTGGVDMENLDYKKEKGVGEKYAVSKGGNVLHAMEYARRYRDEGIVSVVRLTCIPRQLHYLLTDLQALNPGNLKTELQRHVPYFVNLLINLITYPAVNGAYTELFAGLSPEVSKAEKGTWVVPFGRIMPLREDLAEGGNAKEFWEWSEKQVERYV
jgi:retinol dehydrogenase-12